MYRCEDCGAMFSEPKLIRYCKDEYNGTQSLFGNWQHGYYEACPECESEEITSYYEEDEDENEGT